MTRPFADSWTSVEQVIDFGKRHRVTGFNRECIRAYIFWRLHQHFQCTSFVETGTMYGNTSGFVRRAFRTAVFTSEIHPTYHLVSRANLFWASGITSCRSDSVEFLKTICREPVIGSNPMFYLDAHWYENMPLPDELVCIGDRCEKGVILIDDFLIPWEPRYRYDEYPGLRISLEVINTTLKVQRKDVSVYLPNYSPDQDPTGLGIGFAVILMGQEDDLPIEKFPFELLAKVDC